MKSVIDRNELSGRTRLKERVRNREMFWLYGGKYCGKSYLLDSVVEKFSATSQSEAPRIQVVRLFEGISVGEWATSLFESVGKIFEPPNFKSAEEKEESIWKEFCDSYQKASDVFVVLDGWQWMPAGLSHSGWSEIARRDLKVGIVSRASALNYIKIGYLAAFPMIECPLLREEERELFFKMLWGEELGEERLARIRELSDYSGGNALELMILGKVLEDEQSSEQRQELVREVKWTVAREVVEGLSPDQIDCVAVLSQVKEPVSRSRFWRYFDRNRLGPAIENGLIQETINRVKIYPAIVEGSDEFAEGVREDWESLLCLLREEFVRKKGSKQWWALFGAFCKIGSLSKKIRPKQEVLGQLFSSLDSVFPLYLLRDNLEDLLAGFEKMSPMQMRGLPNVRFRFAQCLTMTGRDVEANPILSGLMSMKNTDAGKNAFLWKWMWAAHGGEAEEAIEQLSSFLKDRVEPGEPLELRTRFLLTRILVYRGFYRQALPIAEGALRVVQPQVELHDALMLKSYYGLCFSFVGDLDSGLELMRQACEEMKSRGMDAGHMEARHSLAWVCYETRRFREAREQIEIVRELYKKKGDVQNLRLLRVMEAVIWLLEDESEDRSESPNFREILGGPTGEIWSYFDGDRTFLRGLLAKRAGKESKGIKWFQESLKLHTEGGSTQAVGRILRELLPLILQGLSFQAGRDVLGRIAPSGRTLRELGLEEFEGDVARLIWLTGDFSRWGDLFGSDDVIESDRIVPSHRGLSSEGVIGEWVGLWEAAIAGKATDFTPFKDGGGSKLWGLHYALQAVWREDVDGCRRGLFLCKELDLKGSVFGFLRGLVEAFCRDQEEVRKWRGEMIAFWRGLSPEILVEQLQWWENLLETTSAELPSRWKKVITEWVDCVHQWRVEEAMLIDLESGIVIQGGREVVFDVDSVSFSMLSALARKRSTGEPLAMSELFEEVWERSFNPSSCKNNVYVGIRALREELAALGAEASIEVIRGKGYRLASSMIEVP